MFWKPEYHLEAFFSSSFDWKQLNLSGNFTFLAILVQISWMEKFLQKGIEITAPVPMAPPGTTGLGGFEVPLSKGCTLRSDASALNVGVLHLVPTLEVFPLLADPKMYA